MLQLRQLVAVALGLGAGLLGILALAGTGSAVHDLGWSAVCAGAAVVLLAL